MTLNLMLTSRTAVFLSGDFRMSYYGGGFKDDLRAQKLIPVIRRGWSALVAFTGVAKTTAGVDVGDWIAEQLAGLANDASFHELPTRLKSVEAWLAAIRGYKRLAFSVVGFKRRRPVAMVISNFTDLSRSDFNPPLDHLQISDERPKKPKAYATGDWPAVPASGLTRLCELVSRNVAPREICAAMAEVNVQSADRSDSDSISKPCVTGFLLASGAAEVAPHGIPAGVEYIPGFVARQLEENGVRGFNRRFDDHGIALPPQWVGMTAKVESGRGRPWAVATLHVMRNVAEPVGSTPPPGTSVFWKVAGPNEPPVNIRLAPPAKPNASDELSR